MPLFFLFASALLVYLPSRYFPWAGGGARAEAAPKVMSTICYVLAVALAARALTTVWWDVGPVTAVAYTLLGWTFALSAWVVALPVVAKLTARAR